MSHKGSKPLEAVVVRGEGRVIWYPHTHRYEVAYVYSREGNRDRSHGPEYVASDVVASFGRKQLSKGLIKRAQTEQERRRLETHERGAH